VPKYWWEDQSSASWNEFRWCKVRGEVSYHKAARVRYSQMEESVLTDKENALMATL
jgi:hypothetical protein